MKKRYELFATVSEWTDPATGKKCKRTAQIGTVFQSPSGRLSMKLELLPLIPQLVGVCRIPRRGGTRQPQGRKPARGG